MKIIKLFVLVCVLTFVHTFMYANEISEYHEKVIKFFKGKNNLSMVLGAGDNPKNYTRLKEYTFLVNPTKDGSLAAFNDYKRSIDPTHTDIKSLAEINLTDTPIPLILDFNDTPIIIATIYPLNSPELAKYLPKHIAIYETKYASPLSRFLKSFPNQFSKIIFDWAVTKFLDDANLLWLKSIYNALNDDGEFIIDSLSYGLLEVISSGNPAALEKYCEPLSLPNIDTAFQNFLSLKRPVAVSVYIAGHTYKLPTLSEFDNAPDDSWTSKLNECNQQIISKNKALVEFNKSILQKAGFELVEIHRNEPYPANHPHDNKTVDLFYKAYKTDPAKKDPGTKLVKSLEVLKKSLEALTLKLKTLAKIE